MNRLKQVLPFIFPSAAIILVIILAVRWYRLRDERLGQISEFAEGVEIEDLTTANDLLGVSDYESLPLESQTAEAMGEVRYEMTDDKVRFSVTTSLPKTAATYQVWLREVGGQAIKKAFVLEMTKGGYSGSGAISTNTLPFEIVVSKEEVNDSSPEDILLRGVMEKADQSE